MTISIINREETFTPYVFYTRFLDSVAEFYAINKNNTPIEFQLTKPEKINNNDFISEDSNKSKKYRIDPMSIPLFLSITEQFKKVHKTPIKLDIVSNYKTNDLLRFLNHCKFFTIAGNDAKNELDPQKPEGLDIFNFDYKYLKALPLQTNKYNEFHKLRAYSESLPLPFYKMPVKEAKKYSQLNDEQTRDLLESEYFNLASSDFLEIFVEQRFEGIFDKLGEELPKFRSSCGDTIGQLVSNGVMYSESDVFCMLFINKYAIKIAVSDNGVGFETTLREKKDFVYGNLTRLLLQNKENLTSFISENKMNSLTSIFEALFYSMTKYRYGLFDLMCNTVNLNGSFKLHTDFAQIIISDRMSLHLKQLQDLREPIRNCYELKDNKPTIVKSIELEQYKEIAQKIFVSFFNDTVDKYIKDIIYSSIKFYKGPFKGVHCEVEIPLL